MMPAIAMAAGKTEWSGKDADGGRYYFADTGGGNWDGVFFLNGKRSKDTYEEVKRDNDCIEVAIPGVKDSAIRLYDNHMEVWSPARGKWVELARGRWTN
jgi:hypothetical protein